MGYEAEVFGKYFLVDRIATGGMAEIFKAKTYGDRGFENLVVIKRILAHLSANEDFVDMFIDEAKVTVALQHANIVRVHDFGKIGDSYFLAMELVDGKDLRHLLRKLSQRRKVLPVEHVAFIALETAKGLRHAHEKRDLRGRPQGIVHRDVSPSNVLISYDGDVKVADFGIAKAATNSVDTNSGVLKGKFEYMSPEQARAENVDHRSDLFSLGILMHEMLTARRLFKGDSDLQTVERIKNSDAPPPSMINPRVPEALDRIVCKALTRDRDARYPSAKALIDDLQEYLFPANPDEIRADLGRLMRELFDDEIDEEAERLDEGSRTAEVLRDRLPGDAGWDGGTHSTIDSSVHPAAPWSLALVFGGMFAVALGMVVVGGAAIWWVARPVAPEVAAVQTGVIDVTVLPEASIWIDGHHVADGATVTVEAAPGPHVVRLEREGHVPVEVIVEVQAGSSSRIVRGLEREPEPIPEPEPVAAPAPAPAPSGRPRPAPAPEPAAAPGTLAVALTGGGWAWVYVDDVKLDRTAPLSGLSLEPGPHVIRVENADLGIGHTERVTITAGETTTVRVRPL